MMGLIRQRLSLHNARNTRLCSLNCQVVQSIRVSIPTVVALVRQYSIFSGCCDDCGNDCAATNAEAMADDLVNQINTDPILSLGSATNSPYSQNSFTNRLVRAKKIVASVPPTPSSTCQQYLLMFVIMEMMFLLVQFRLSTQLVIRPVSRINRSGSTSTYQLIQAYRCSGSCPFNNSGICQSINDCATCPAGYTLTTGLYATRDHTSGCR